MSSVSIRRLFLEPKPSYSITDATTLLDMDRRNIRRWIEAGELEGVETPEGLALPWAELVSFGMDF